MNLNQNCNVRLTFVWLRSYEQILQQFDVVVVVVDGVVGNDVDAGVAVAVDDNADELNDDQFAKQPDQIEFV